VARPLRIQAPGLTYHVTSRGVRRATIFCDALDRQRFLALLADVVDRYALRCHAYCEMTNHYHLAITTTDANLSRAVQQLNGDYAQWWNWRHERVGHVFQGRFNAQVVQDEAYLWTVCRYIVLNPVRAGMVRSPSTGRGAVIARRPAWLDRRRFLDCTRLREFVAPGDPAMAQTSFGRPSWRRTLMRCSCRVERFSATRPSSRDFDRSARTRAARCPDETAAAHSTPSFTARYARRPERRHPHGVPGPVHAGGDRATPRDPPEHREQDRVGAGVRA
jgi:REP element-mobilizing transposase RayT